MADFRELCAELIRSWDADGCDWKPQHQARWEATLSSARAALASSQPRKIVQLVFDPDGSLCAVSDDGLGWYWSDALRQWRQFDPLPPHTGEIES